MDLQVKNKEKDLPRKKQKKTTKGRRKETKNKINKRTSQFKRMRMNNGRK